MEFRRPEGVLVRRAANELVLLNTNSEVYFSLDEVGACAYEAMVDGTLDQAVAAVIASFDGCDEAEVRSDLRTLGDELVEKGLLELNG